MPGQQDQKLREEIVELGELLGKTIQEFAGQECFHVVERVRRLSRAGRGGDEQADSQLTEFLSSLGDEHLRIVIRAFTMFLDLTNVAEDRQRLRVLRDRARKAAPNPRKESIADAIGRLRSDGKSADEIQDLLDRLEISLVFTAHPTEAKRRSIRGKLRRIRELLGARKEDDLPAERAEQQERIEAELAKWWMTDFIRPWRPTVLQEVRRGLSVSQILWDVAPDTTSDLRNALSEIYPEYPFDIRPSVALGSWIGGDRDGHPYVTPDVTRQTLIWLRQAAIEFHLGSCRELYDSLSVSARQMHAGSKLAEAIEQCKQSWPTLESELQEIPPQETIRQWLRMIRWRLRRTLMVQLDSEIVEGSYETSQQLEGDVAKLHEIVMSARRGELLAVEIERWLDRIRIFGLQLARLDIRQDSRVYSQVIDELLIRAKIESEPSKLSESERQVILLDTLNKKLSFDYSRLTDQTRETVNLFGLLRHVVASYGVQALGGHVVSMTQAPSDILSIMWLWSHGGAAEDSFEPVSTMPIQTIPLLETIADLEHGPKILTDLFELPAYQEHLRGLGQRQVVMLGYSDSTKDGGYLSACWSLYQCQKAVQEVATNSGVRLTFFHGRGGSLGRGGGPAARSILSLPPGTFDGSMRLTEQGEVLAERYDDPEIAHRHLEQLLWSCLLAIGAPAQQANDNWNAALDHLAERSFRFYRRLVEQPGFVEFFRLATPVSEVEQLPIGSRPSRRRGGAELSDLRAIPWVFSWTQARCLVPAWYGIGSAVEEKLNQPNGLETLREMYQQWPFFRATIDNAELALAKSDIGIAERYAELAQDSESAVPIGEMINAEFARTKEVILKIIDQQELLDGTPWLKESIRVRNRYIDPLNMVQIELLKRLRKCEADGASEEELDSLHHLARLTIKGLAAGMRTTG